MIPSLIICIASGLFFLLVCYGKRRELNGSRPLIRIGSNNMDSRLSQYYIQKKEYIASIDKQYMKDKLHDAAENLEHFGIYVVEKTVRLFSKARDRVTGKDLPKTKGAIAFFLENISHKKDQK